MRYPAPAVVLVLNVGGSGSRSVAKAYGMGHEVDGRTIDPEGMRQRSKGKLIYSQVSTWFKHHLDDLREEFPDAQYVHLVRDGRDCVKSYQAHGGRVESAGCPGDLPPTAEQEETVLGKACQYWNYWNREIEAFLDGKYRVRLEDLDGLPRLGKHRGPKTPWRRSEWETFVRICGETQKRYGYPLEPPEKLREG